MVYQDENGYVHLSDTGGSAIGIVDTLDTNGGTIRNIYGIDLSNDTVTVADLAQGVTAHNAQGQAITGTGGSGYTIDDIANGEPSGAVTITASSISSYGFVGRKATSVYIPGNCDVNDHAFYLGCPSLTKIVAPKATALGSNIYEGSSLQYFVFGSFNAKGWVCKGTNLLAADISMTGSITTQSFYGDTKLETLVLRPSSIVALGSTNVFTNTPFASGKSGGTIYIPKVLYDHLGDGTSSDYQAATNWSTIHGYGTITWAKIEGSQYENAYVDGTTIPTV